MKPIGASRRGSAGAAAVSSGSKAGVMDDGTRRRAPCGTPQGGVISPLLSNIYLRDLDRVWTRRCAQLGALVRYADDFVVMSSTEK